MRALSAVICAALLGGCGDTGALPALGESCSVLCAPGLTCSPSKVCEKSCRCDGGPTCANNVLADGCPATAECVVERATGEGRCAVICGAGRACPSGEGSCASAPDGVTLCVGDGYPWVGLDGGAPPDDAAAAD